MEEIVIRPIGIIHNQNDEKTIKSSLMGVKGTIEIFSEFIEGLDEIDGFSHLIVTSFLHKVGKEKQKTLKVRFRRLTLFGMKLEELPEVGVFCSDSPHRPVPLAITIVHLLKREGRFLHVDNLDLFNLTPVLDIKPYTDERIVDNIELPAWYEKLQEKVYKIAGKKFNL